MPPSVQLPRLVLCALLVVCGLLHLQKVSGSVPTDLSHPGWNHDKLVEQGEKSGLGAIPYMDKLEENCFENATLHLRESCNDSRAARA